MKKMLRFELGGDAPGFHFVPGDWVDCDSEGQFKDELLECVEEGACWGVTLVGDTFSELWAEVRDFKEKGQVPAPPPAVTFHFEGDIDAK